MASSALELVDRFILAVDSSTWRITTLYPDNKHGILVVMQALTGVELADDTRHEVHVINKFDYVVGYLADSHPCCLQVHLHTSNRKFVFDLVTYKMPDLKELTACPHTWMIASSIPECLGCTVERRVRDLKKDLNDSIEWYPGVGSKYHAMIEDSDFKQRWQIV